METTLPLPFLVSVQVPPGLAKLDGLTREEVSLLATPFFEAKPQLLEKLSRFLGRHNYEFHSHIDVTSFESSEDVMALLDRGTRRVFVKPEKLSEYTKLGSRVLPAVSTPNLSAASAHGLLIKNFDLKSCDVDKFAAEAKAKKISNLYLKPVDGTDVEKLIEVAKKSSAIPILPSTQLTTDKSDSSKLLLSKVIAAYWQSDRPDGLIPTVVTDESGVALGLAYSSENSVLEALHTQGGVYQSRKRGLWVKGATSGDTQELIRLALDCDNDTLKFVVRQKGRFCHLEQSGCFGDLTGMAALEKTLQSRKRSAPEGSYTARLFSDEKLLRAKIMEEAE
jgi:phosphoribosyl-ATP pyrophosphohydrolase/phosphoribosyl-AMP cyclohydrolase/histidinol dehydrogenase